MADLLDPSGKPVTVPDEQVPQLYLSGGYKFPEGAVTTQSPGGEMGQFTDPQQLGEAFRQGHQYVSPTATKAYQDQQKFGTGPANMGKALVGGIASAATLGLSDLAARKLNPEFANEDAKVRAANPGSSLTGELAGGLALGAGSGMAAKAAAEGLGLVGAFSPAEVIAQAGGIGGSVARAGTRLAADAALGSAMGVGQGVSEAALGDKDLAAEHLLSRGVLGGILGGGTGLGLWLGGEALSPVLDRFQGELGSATTKLSEKAAELGPEVEADARQAAANTGVRETTSAMESTLKAFNALAHDMRGGSDGLSGIREAEARAGLSDATKTPLKPIQDDLLSRVKEQQARLDGLLTGENAESYDPKMIDRAQAVLTDLGDNALKAPDPYVARTAVRGALEDFGDRASFGGEGIGNTPKNNTAKELADVYGSLREHLTDPDLYGTQGLREDAIRKAEAPLVNKTWAGEDSPLVRDFKAYFGDPRQRGLTANEGKWQTYLKQKAVDNPAADPKTETLNKMMGALQTYADTAAESFKNVPQTVDKYEQFAEKYQQLATHHADTMGEIQPSIGKAIGAQQALGAPPTQTPWESLGGMVTKGLEKIPGAGPFMAGAAEHIGANPGKTLDTLSTFAKIAQRSTSSLQNGIRNFLRGTGTTYAPVFSAETLRSTRFDTGTRGDNDLDKRTQEIDRYASNPQALDARVQSALGPLQEHAPNVTAAMAAKASGDLQYLQSKIPRNPATQFQAGLSAQPFEASHHQRRQLAGAIEGVTDPVGSLRRAMSTGMVNQSMLDAVQARNPKIYDQFHAETLLAISKLKKPLGYSQKLTLSRLTGAPLSISMTPAGVASLQAGFAHAGPGSPAGATPRSPHAATSKMDLAKGLAPREAHLGKGT